jgi:hypothetical protein
MSEPRASRRYSLAATAENNDPRADESCASAENPTGLNSVDDGKEAKPVINRFGNPTVSLWNVAETNISMPIRHGMFVARFSALTEQHERLARLEVLVRIAAELETGG